ncbi:electron transfer flavoprotein subunit beta/FixA family protein [candidate division KSB1 bacterium]
MKIIVCLKHVPDSETKVSIKEGDTWIDESNVNFVMNPYDEFAVEEALRIKEKVGGEVVVVSLGPDRVTTAIRNALAMGADSGIHIKDTDFRIGLSSAKIIAETIKSLEADLILFGKQAIDDDNMQIGPMVAEFLDIPGVTVVTKLEIDNDTVTAEREIEGGKEVVEVKLPAVVTAQKGLNEPRYASLKGIMMAKKKSIEEKTASDISCGISISKIEYPPKRKEGKMFKNGVEDVPEVIKLLREEAKAV